MSSSEGQGVEETKLYVADLVTQQLHAEGFRLSPDQVILVSARNALLSRLVLAGRASEDSLMRFLNVAFGTFGSAMVRQASRGGVGVGSEGARSTGSSARAAAAAIGQAHVMQAASAGVYNSVKLEY
jgi:hypothetical protein